MNLGTPLLVAASKHVPPVGTGTIVFAVVFSAVWLIQVARFRTFWNYVPPAMTGEMVGLKEQVPIQLTFRRQAPSASILGGFVISVTWLVILVPNAGWSSFPIVILALFSLASTLVTISVWLFNRPRRLVPPQLRDLPGLLSKAG